MPIKSYLVFPKIGKASSLLKSLSLLQHCEVTTAKGKEVFVLVTDTQTDNEEQALLNKLESEDGLHHINLISGFITEAYEKGSV